MNKKTLCLVAIFSGIILLNLFIGKSVFGYPSGSPAGYTGSPGDGYHCTSCHGGSAATVANWITSNIPASGYVAGTVYNITATVSGTGKKGFEVSPQNATGTQLGILAPGSNNHLVGGTKYVTQNSSGSSSGTSTYNFTWTAPVAGTGQVTFYGAFTVGKSATKLSTMVVNENSTAPLSATASATPSPICAGQSTQLSALASGGSGNYTYTWSSTPPGFSSTLQNPTAYPVLSTFYSVLVSDGTSTIDANTTVTVSQPVTVNAGHDTTLTPAITQVPLSGTASNYSSVLWSTVQGTGTFSEPTAMNTIYYPSAPDKTTGQVILKLTAYPQSPCVLAEDDIVIHFEWPTTTPDHRQENPGINIYPNPARNHVNLNLTGSWHNTVTVTIMDVTGKIIVHRDMNTTEPRPEKIDLSGYPGGMYFLKATSPNGLVIRKLILE